MTLFQWSFGRSHKTGLNVSYISVYCYWGLDGLFCEYNGYYTPYKSLLHHLPFSKWSQDCGWTITTKIGFHSTMTVTVHILIHGLKTTSHCKSYRNALLPYPSLSKILTTGLYIRKAPYTQLPFTLILYPWPGVSPLSSLNNYLCHLPLLNMEADL